jgi:hypothetical protein
VGCYQRSPSWAWGCLPARLLLPTVSPLPPLPSLLSNPRLDLAYVHIVEPRVAGIDDVTTTDSIAPFRQVG